MCWFINDLSRLFPVSSETISRWVTTNCFIMSHTYMRKVQELNLFQYSNTYPTRRKFTQFILYGNRSTCFGWYYHPSSGAQTTVSTAFGICRSVTATCRLAAGNSNRMTNTRCCRYSCLRSC